MNVPADRDHREWPAAERLTVKLLHGTSPRSDEIDALGRVFEAEIESAVGGRVSHLFQSRASIYKRLAFAELIRHTEEIIPGGGPLGPIRVSGYELTELGRRAYCCFCPDDER
jgi:hypothetical protein